MRFQRPPERPFRHKNFERRTAEPPRQHDEDDQHDVIDDEETETGIKRESEYLRELTEKHSPVEVHLTSGEKFRGFIEYYDKRFIRLTRKGAPNLFIYKHDIKYLVENEE